MASWKMLIYVDKCWWFDNHILIEMAISKLYFQRHPFLAHPLDLERPAAQVLQGFPHRREPGPHQLHQLGADAEDGGLWWILPLPAGIKLHQPMALDGVISAGWGELRWITCCLVFVRKMMTSEYFMVHCISVYPNENVFVGAAEHSFHLLDLEFFH